MSAMRVVTRMVITPFAMLALLIPLAAQSPLLAPVLPKGKVSGMVRRAGTGEPLAGARITLTQSEIQVSRSAKTDNLGRFLFTDVIGSSYLEASGLGYVEQDEICIERIEKGTGCDEIIKAGATVDGIVIDLVPTGAVGGVVKDTAGNPLPLIPVELLDVSYNESGHKVLKTLATHRTDDRGEYRFHYINPGRYYLRAGSALDKDETEGRRSYRRQSYPAQEDLERGVPIEVTSGSERGGLDFALTRVERFRVRGHIQDELTGKPVTEVRISVAPRGSSQAFSPPFKIWPDGAFETADLLPGRYTLIATPQAFFQTNHETGTEAGYATVDISDRDVDSVRVVLMPGGSLSGHVIVEAVEKPESKNRSASRLPTIRLVSVLDGEPIEIPNVLSPALGPQTAPAVQETAPYKEDGTFRFHNLQPGVYRLNVTAQGNLYVKQARLGGVDVLMQDFTISEDTDGLTIVLASDMAVVSGHVSTDGGAGPKGAVVVLVPDRFPAQADRLKHASVGRDGVFGISDVPPGDYRAFAAVTENYSAFFNSEFRARFEGHGVPVHVTTGPNPTLAVPLIPSLNP